MAHKFGQLKPTALPADPAERLMFVVDNYFRKSRLALSRAAGVSRAAVNQWPPQSALAMDKHLLVAVEREIQIADDRSKVLFELKMGLREHIGRSTAEHEIRAELEGKKR
jgi:hypothetical protein